MQLKQVVHYEDSLKHYHSQRTTTAPIQNNNNNNNNNNELRLQYKRLGKKEKCGEGGKDSSIYLCCHTHKRPSKYVVFNNK